MTFVHPTTSSTFYSAMLSNFLNILVILHPLFHIASGSLSSKPDATACPEFRESLQAVKLVFHDAAIPGDLKIDFEPQALLNIAWPPPDPETEPVYTYPGRHLLDNVTFATPTFTATGLHDDNQGPFVIIMLAPDVPASEKPSLREFIGSDFYVTHRRGKGGSVLVNQTVAVAQWRRPHPPRTSPEQRYVFLMYDQPPTFNSTLNLDNTTFRNFDVVDYAVRNGLGDPIAGTFMYIESNASCWRDGCT
ncbi:hypothetical protein CVT24_009254 [Panaeolus cyanescens]|uniref:Uncharacterized protein n=1 Tax=Panaeolus cyanescens TaxID=181874 RepID=A0A409Y811_9AGAR|nr:hypothetical protein CVT24_009254 [Panaeolus cyanescens]